MRVDMERPDPRSYCNTANLPPIRIGVEVELENLAPMNNSLIFWSLVSDGSLRNGGGEFIFKHPYGGDDIVLALDELRDVLRGTGATATHRCSVHVHADVRDFAIHELESVILCYAALESALFTTGGKDRYSNIYCPGLTSCYNQVQILADGMHNTEQFNYTCSEYPKYSAMNINSIPVRGSIEFRMFRGSSDMDEILQWVKRIMYFMHTARRLSPEVVVDLVQNNHEELLRTCMEVDAEILDNFCEYKDNNCMNCLDIWFTNYARRKKAKAPGVSTGPVTVSVGGDSGAMHYTSAVPAPGTRQMETFSMAPTAPAPRQRGDSGDINQRERERLQAIIDSRERYLRQATFVVDDPTPPTSDDTGDL